MIVFWHDVAGSLGVVGMVGWWALVWLTALGLGLLALAVGVSLLALGLHGIHCLWCYILGKPSPNGKIDCAQTQQIVRLRNK